MPDIMSSTSPLTSEVENPVSCRYLWEYFATRCFSYNDGFFFISLETNWCRHSIEFLIISNDSSIGVSRASIFDVMGWQRENIWISHTSWPPVKAFLTGLIEFSMLEGTKDSSTCLISHCKQEGVMTSSNLQEYLHLWVKLPLRVVHVFEHLSGKSLLIISKNTIGLIGCFSGPQYLKLGVWRALILPKIYMSKSWSRRYDSCIFSWFC